MPYMRAFEDSCYYNKEKVKSLESELSEMKKQQDEMLKILYEIKAKVK